MPHDPTTKELKSAEVFQAVESIAGSWRVFGTHLGVSRSRLKKIRSDTNVNKRCMLATLKKWCSPYIYSRMSATIPNLTAAVRRIGNESLAQRIESDPMLQEYSQGTQHVHVIITQPRLII